jgi:hypothetical protein
MRRRRAVVLALAVAANGRMLVGAQPFEVFHAAIEEALAKASRPSSDTERSSSPTRPLLRK